MDDQEPVTHPSPQPGPVAVSNRRNISRFSQGNPPQEYSHTSECHPCSSSQSGVILSERGGSGGEGVKHSVLCSPHGGLRLEHRVTISSWHRHNQGSTTLQGILSLRFSKESTILTLIQFQIWLETHSKRAPFAACLHLSESQHEMH